MKAYVISLNRAAERRAYMASELAKAGLEYEFIEAVDGKTVQVSDPAVVAPTWLGRSPFWPNVAGCALSHLEAYRRALDEGLRSALVLEDDVRLPLDLDPLADATAGMLEGAEVALLHYHSEAPCRISTRGATDLPGGRKLSFPLDIVQLGSAGAYVITAEACERMAKAVLPVRVPADDWAFFYNDAAIERIRCVSPVPIRKTAKFRSTIGYYDPESWRASLSSVADRLPLPAVQRVLQLRRQRVHDRWSRVELVEERSPLEQPPH